MSTLENSLPKSIKYSESIVELKTKIEILTVHVFYVDELVRRINILFTLCMHELVLISKWYAHGCVWLPHRYYLIVCFHMVNIYHIYCDAWLVFISFSYFIIPT